MHSPLHIGIIDVDGHNFPNLPLMKLSAYFKNLGDDIHWYSPVLDSGEPLDYIYMSKIFSHTADFDYPLNAHRIIRGGTGYYYPNGGDMLPEKIEHCFPDYSLYPTLTQNTAFGFLTRGCPRQCDFCIVSQKEGTYSHKVADLREFWNGQKNIKLLNPNITACPDWKELFQQLIDSHAWIDFTQGLDIRLMTDEKIHFLKKMKIKQIHFAWDNYNDKESILPQLIRFKKLTDWDKRKLTVYVLTNFNSTFEQDLERIYTLRDIGYHPYVMIYEKEKLTKGHRLLHLQRWVNSKIAFEAIPCFDDYNRHKSNSDQNHQFFQEEIL